MFALAILLRQFALPTAAAQLQISEIRIDQPGADSDEYIELSGTAGADLSGYSYIVIGDGAAGSGVVEMVVGLTGLKVPDDGYALLAEPSFSLGPIPDLISTLNLENADNVTHLIVSGLTAASGVDLDTDDDGSLDHVPWDGMIDCVAILDAEGSGDKTYCDVTVGPDGGSAPFHVYLDGGWQIGTADPLNGVDTPGAAPIDLPVEVTRLDWVWSDGAVVVNWASSGPCECTAFRVELLNEDHRETVATLEINEDRRQGDVFTLPVYGLRPGSHSLRLVTIAPDGTQDAIGLLNVSVPTNAGFSLTRPYPNPTRSVLQFEVESEQGAAVDIAIYDATGRKVRKVFCGRTGGAAVVSFTASLRTLPTGVYFLVAQSSGTRRVRKVIRV